MQATLQAQAAYWPVVLWNCTIRRRPFGRTRILCIDDKPHAARFSCGEQATPCGRHEKPHAQALPLHTDMRRNTHKTEPQNIVLCKAAAKSPRRVEKRDRARRKAVEGEDRFVITVFDGEEKVFAPPRSWP